jgi:hypothetical protein
MASSASNIFACMSVESVFGDFQLPCLAAGMAQKDLTEQCGDPVRGSSTLPASPQQQ